MKKLLILLCISIYSLSSFTQVDLTTSPASMLFGNLNIGADVSFSEGFSSEVKFGIISSSLATKFYVNPKTRTDGFYVGAFGKATNYGSFADRVGVGFLAGIKVRSQKRFLFDANFGIGRAIFNDDQLDFDEFDIGGGPMLLGKLSVGWRIGRLD